MAVIPWPLNPRGAPAKRSAARAVPAENTMPAPTRAGGIDDVAAIAATLIQSRQTILPKRLGGPGPNADELAQILSAAAHAPDHGQLVPWRFVLVPEAARAALADVFAQSLQERDSAATAEQVAQAREKAHRAPVLMLAVVDARRGDGTIDLAERLVSAGCAVQNMLLMATAQGYGSALTSGKALKATSLRTLFRLAESEQALCFISIGTVQSRKSVRSRPAACSYVSTLDAQRGVVPGF